MGEMLERKRHVTLFGKLSRTAVLLGRFSSLTRHGKTLHEPQCVAV
jgi:hypothetical protein